MLKRLLFITMAATLALTMGYADQSKGKLIIPVNKTNPTDGKQMYTSYCAPCHGVDGRGHGPASSALKAQPTDLTGLAKANHGKDPETHVGSVVRFGSELPAHGSADKTGWGGILGTMSVLNPPEEDVE